MEKDLETITIREFCLKMGVEPENVPFCKGLNVQEIKIPVPYLPLALEEKREIEEGLGNLTQYGEIKKPVGFQLACKFACQYIRKGYREARKFFDFVKSGGREVEITLYDRETQEAFFKKIRDSTYADLVDGQLREIQGKGHVLIDY